MDKEVKIYFKVDGLDTYLTNLDDLKSALSGVSAETERVTAATKEIEAAFDSTADDAEALERKLNAMEGGVKVLAGSLEGLAGAASLLGIENNEFFKELEENTIGVLALARGAIDVSEGYSLLRKNTQLATIAQRAFNAVSNANPYILLAGAVISLAGALVIFKSRAEDAADAQIKFNRTFNELADRRAQQIEFERELAKVKGELTPEKEIEFNKRLIAVYDEEISKSRQRIEAAKFGDITEEEQELIDRLQANISLRETQAQQLRNNNILTVERNKAEKNLADQEEKNEKNRVAREKKAEQRQEQELARITAINLAKEQAAQAQAEVFDNQAELEDELFRATLTAREQELYDLQEDYYRRLNLAEGNAELIAQVEEQYRLDKKEKEDEFRREDLERLKTYLDEEQMLIDEYAAREVLAYQELQDAKVSAAESGFGLLEAIAGDNKKLDNAIFIAQKAFEVAQVLVKGRRDIAEARSNTIKEVGMLTTRALAGDAVAAALIPGTQAAGVATVNALRLNTAAGIAGILAAGISRFASVGGDSGTGASIPTPAPTNAINYTFGQQQGQTITPNQFSTGQPIQAYVLASDVNNAQQAQQQIIQLSKL